MAWNLDETIAALASAPGGAARGVVRASGPQAPACVERCFRPQDGSRLTDLAQPTVVAGSLTLAAPLSRTIACDAYVWPSAQSYTRQPTVELHMLGSPPILQAAVETLCAAGARPAQPGEFTLRAFLAGRLDLTQAEAVLGVIDAAGDRPLRTALEQLAGGLSRPLTSLRDRLLELLAHLEAGLDFVEEDIEFISRTQLVAELDAALAIIATIDERMQTRGRADDVVRVALVGHPNVGKSSLFNALAGQAQAIVSPISGTTRDYLSLRLRLDDVECELIDTAGLDAATDDSISTLAQAATARQRGNADIELLCLDASRELSAQEHMLLASDHPARVVVWTKSDLVEQAKHDSGVLTSARTQQGLVELRSRLSEMIREARVGNEHIVAGTAVRCQASAHRAAESLGRARELAETSGGEELVAAELRIALGSLGEMVGAIYTDDLLDRIFSRFCIGK